MTGCIGALCCWRRKRTAGDVACETEKPHATRVDSVDSVIPDPEKPPLEVRAGHVGHASKGVPVRAGVNPASSAYPTLADTKRADSASTKATRSFRDDATLKDEELDETEERDRRRKAEEEEQERLDFFQMM